MALFNAVMITPEHAIVILEVKEQGGGVEEYMVWCHTCDPAGSSTVTVPYDPKAYLEAIEAAAAHLEGVDEASPSSP